MSSKDENVNENDKTLTSLKDKNEKQNNYKNASKKKDENINISQNIWETLMIKFLKNQ